MSIKIFPKQYEDVADLDKFDDVRVKAIGSAWKTVEDLADRYRQVSDEFNQLFFPLIVKQIWLEQQFCYNGDRRRQRAHNGNHIDWAYGYFQKVIVKRSQKGLTNNFVFTAVSTYLKEFFPDFLKHDPFLEPEYYSYPYKHLTLDHLVFVYMVDERLDYLAYAEEQQMSVAEFVNWGTNQAFCYNDSVGKIVYQLSRSNYRWPYLSKVGNKRRNSRKKNNSPYFRWQFEKFTFDLPSAADNKE
jgi:hypothetical protein